MDINWKASNDCLFGTVMTSVMISLILFGHPEPFFVVSACTKKLSLSLKTKFLCLIWKVLKKPLNCDGNVAQTL